MTSIVIFPFGTGFGGIPIDSFAQTFAETLFKYISKKDESFCLTKIYMCVPEEDKLKFIDDAVAKRELRF